MSLQRYVAYHANEVTRIHCNIKVINPFPNMHQLAASDMTSQPPFTRKAATERTGEVHVTVYAPAMLVDANPSMPGKVERRDSAFSIARGSCVFDSDMFWLLYRGLTNDRSDGSGGEPDCVETLRDLVDLELEEAVIDLVGSEAVGGWPHALPPPPDPIVRS